MSFHGRSIDDLPLAAYSTGMQPDESLEPGPEPEAGASTADPSGAAMSAAAAPAPAPAGPTSAPTASFAPPALGSDSLDTSLEPGAAAPRRRPAMPEWLAHPRAHSRDPRLLMTGLVGLGVVLLGASVILGGGSPAGAAGPATSPTPRPVAATPVPPSGDASIEISGKLTGSFALAGASGTGPAQGGRIAATWADAAGQTLNLTGAASPGTRTTDGTFVLTWTSVVDGAPVVFTSAGGECTVGMAVQPKSVTGSIVCKKLKSDDGSTTIELRGTYRT